MENKSILDELNDLEKSMSQAAEGKNSIGNTLTEPVVQVTEKPVEETKAPVEPPVETPKVEEKPTEMAKEKTEEPKAEQKPTVDVDAVIDQWDSEKNVPDTKTLNQSDVDFSDIAKELGIPEIKTKADLVKTVSEYKTKASDLEKRVNSIPQELEKAIEIANLGGNYLEYLGVGQVDWSKEDPVSLYENYVIDRAADKDGNVDFDKVNEYLDSLNETEKEIRGKELQLQYINHQTQTKESIAHQSRQQRAQFENTVKSELLATDNIAGFKLSQAHKDELYSDITSGMDLKPSSVKERVTMAFLRKYFDKVDSFRKTQIRNATLREVLQEAQVSEIKSPVSPVAPPNTKGFTFDDYIKDLDAKKL